MGTTFFTARKAHKIAAIMATWRTIEMIEEARPRFSAIGSTTAMGFEVRTRGGSLLGNRRARMLPAIVFHAASSMFS